MKVEGQVVGDTTAIRLKDVNLFSPHNFVVNVNGKLPVQLTPIGQFQLNDMMDLGVLLEGNLPVLLPRVASREIAFAEGNGKAFIQLVGGAEEIMIKKGLAEFRNCQVNPMLLITEISELSLLATIDNNKVTVVQAQGQIFDAVLTATSTHNLSIEFPHFKLAGLDWGILQFHTPDEGVGIYIPNLILEREEGKFWVEGNSFDFGLFGGSFDDPYLNATFILDDLSFTWPSLEDDPVPKEHYGKPAFASRLHWDVMIKPKKNVWYINDFATLLVDEKSELWFKGKYADSTMGHWR